MSRTRRLREIRIEESTLAAGERAHETFETVRAELLEKGDVVFLYDLFQTPSNPDPSEFCTKSCKSKQGVVEATLLAHRQYVWITVRCRVCNGDYPVRKDRRNGIRVIFRSTT